MNKLLKSWSFKSRFFKVRSKFLLFLLVFFLANTTVSGAYTCGIFTFNVIITPPTCGGLCNGSVQIFNIIGGTPPYSYLWSNGDTTSNPTALCSGIYNVNINDAIGNFCSTVFNVPAPSPIIISLTGFPVSCYGFADGSICANVTGGSTPYTYAWNTIPVQTTPCVNNVSVGTYALCVTDSNGCIVCSTAVVAEPPLLVVVPIVTNASCSSCCDGSIVLTPVGGTPPYNYVFTPFGSGVNLCPGNYNYCVTDMNGCTTCDSTTVSFSTTINNFNFSEVFSIFPNPTTGDIKLESDEVIKQVIIRNIIGEIIIQEFNSNHLDISNYPNGIYFIEVVTENLKIVQKIVLSK